MEGGESKNAKSNRNNESHSLLLMTLLTLSKFQNTTNRKKLYHKGLKALYMTTPDLVKLTVA